MKFAEYIKAACEELRVRKTLVSRERLWLVLFLTLCLSDGRINLLFTAFFGEEKNYVWTFKME